MSGKTNKDQLKQILAFGYQKGNEQPDISVQELIQELSEKLVSMVKIEEEG